MSLRYLVPALAIAGRAAASCSAATTTVSVSADAAALATCTTFTGSIAIATGTTDNIALNGIQVIEGSLIADNVTQLAEISADSLLTISDSFSLTGLTILSTLNFPQLSDVNTIDWTALPALQGLSFTTGVQTASMVSIQNTELNTLDGINLQVVDTFYIANNPFLNEISMQLGNITTSLIIEANGREVVANFPDLDWAYNMTFRNVSSVNIQSLSSINGSLGFYSNEFLNVSAANLTTVGGSLSFVSNSDLTNITMPSLTTVTGGFQIANNTALKSIDGFPKLATIGGALDFYGNFTTVELPKLADVRGAFNLQSSGDLNNTCSNFKSLAGSNNVIKGTFTCSGAVEDPSSDPSSASATTSGTSSSSTAKSAAAGFAAPVAVTGLMGVLAAVFGLL